MNEGEMYAACYLLLQKIEKSSTVMLDRWSISITNAESESTDDSVNSSRDNLDRRVSEKIPFDIINNYLSIGVVSKSLRSVNVKTLFCFLSFSRSNNFFRF